MDGFLRQSTSATVLLGKFVDDTDGNTAETGLTIANTDIKISKNGAAAASKNSGGATHSANGYYSATFDATDTDTVGRIKISVHVSGALYVEANFQVLEEAVYDALFASSAAGYVESSDLPTNFADLAITSGTGYITGVTNNVNASVVGMSTVALAQFLGQDIGIYTITEGSIFDTLRDEIINDAPTADEIADAVWDEATADHTTAGTFGLGVPVSSSTAASVIGPAVWAQPWSNYNTGNTNMGNLMYVMLNPTTGVLNDLNDIEASDVWDVLYTSYTGSDLNFGTLATGTAVTASGTNAIVDGIRGGAANWNPSTDSLDNLRDRIDQLAGASFATGTDSLEAVRDRIDALLATALAEPTGAPGASETALDKLGYLFAALRNQITVSGATKTFYDDAGSALWAKTLSDDGTTYTETEGS